MNEPILEYVKGKGWVYVCRIPARDLRAGDRVIKAWDKNGNAAVWGNFPYVLANEDYNGAGPRTYAIVWWVKTYTERGFTFEVDT